MNKQKKIFLDKSRIAFDLNHRKTITYNISQYDKAFEKGKTRYTDFDLTKSRASVIKDKSIQNIATYLEVFEKNITARGAKVLWAQDTTDALGHIASIIKENPSALLVKSKSMISEEIGLNEYLEKSGVETVETDLGEFIVQVAGEKPYHILTPAMHKSKEDVAKLFHEKFGTPENASPTDLTIYVRKLLREKFVSADIGVSGANFIVADIGGIGLIENEGNGMMSVSFPKIHIVIAGIEKVIPSVNDLAFFIPLLATMGTGQQVTVYNSLITGPRLTNESNGPEKMYIILLDNNRTKICGQPLHRKALKCLRCGACLNVCPIYKNAGGYTYNTEYTGPIGSVITPFMKGFDQFAHLSFACTVCGRCSEVCPVKIPLHELLLLNRKDFVEEKLESPTWRIVIKMFGVFFKKRTRLDFVSGRAKNAALKRSGQLLGKNKKNPQFAEYSFSRQMENINC
jgi:L-lactate dehydrogenase complex protein LldF